MTATLRSRPQPPEAISARLLIVDDDPKEYVAARVDGDGTLLLSEFTGAARELHGALLVNPYDVDATAAHLAAGLAMPEADRRRRMARLREQVRQPNIYRWAADTLDVLAQLAATRVAA